MAPDRRSLAITTHSAEETETIGERLGRALESGALIALDGDLGAGKTCFVRGLARGLGVVDSVSSPTYALLQSYEGRLPLHHLDAWMEGRERAFLLDGGLEWIASRGVTVIEWAERVADLLPPGRLSVRIERSGAEERVVHIALVGEAAEDGPLGRALAALTNPR
jgi:tRNA threonylcarbamoyladenosine biosynthesis protein TsaE